MESQSKPTLKNIVHETVELGKESFPDSMEFSDIEGIYEKLRFGEVVIKVIGGQVESIQVTHHYKPVLSEKILDN